MKAHKMRDFQDGFECRYFNKKTTKHIVLQGLKQTNKKLKDIQKGFLAKGKS